MERPEGKKSNKEKGRKGKRCQILHIMSNKFYNTTRMLINGNTLDRLILHLTDILEQPIDKSSPSTPGASPRIPLTPSIKAVQNTTSILEGGPKDVVHLLIQLIRWIFVFLFYKICYVKKII